MGTVRKSITFTDKLSEWVQLLVKSGEYANESEYVRDLVRKDRDRNAKFLALKSDIEEGLQSGLSNRSVSDIIDGVEERLRNEGKL